CVLELLPLPSTSADTWTYGSRTGLPDLRDRATYMAQVAPRRAKQLRDRTLEHRPSVVVCYGRERDAQWRQWREQIAGAAFHHDAGGLEVVEAGPTLVVLTRHPVRA